MFTHGFHFLSHTHFLFLPISHSYAVLSTLAQTRFFSFHSISYGCFYSRFKYLFRIIMCPTLANDYIILSYTTNGKISIKTYLKLELSKTLATCFSLDLSVTDASDITTLTKLVPLGTAVNGQLSIRRPFDLSVVSVSAAVLDSLQGSAIKLPSLHKSYTWWLDDPWAAFVTLGGLVFVLALVAIIVLLRSYNK